MSCFGILASIGWLSCVQGFGPDFVFSFFFWRCVSLEFAKIPLFPTPKAQDLVSAGGAACICSCDGLFLNGSGLVLGVSAKVWLLLAGSLGGLSQRLLDGWINLGRGEEVNVIDSIIQE